MVTIKDDCCCEDKALKEQIKERALSSINKIYTTDARTYYPDGTGMVTVPLPTQAQLDQIETNKEDIAALNEEMDGIDAKIQDGDAKLDAKIDAVDATLSEAIAANVTEIATVDKAVTELSEKVAANIPTEYRLYRTGEGKIQLQAETADGTLIDSNTLDMVIPYQYDLIAGTTDRSFKIRITLSNGTTYDTNDFIIPTPGDAPVEVTGIVMTKDPDNVNRFKTGVNLSDGSMIETGYVTFVDSVKAAVADNKLTVAVNDVESVPTNVVTSVAADYTNNLLTVAVNGVSDSVTIGSSSDTSSSPFFVSILVSDITISNADGSDMVIPASTETGIYGHQFSKGVQKLAFNSTATGLAGTYSFTIDYSITGSIWESTTTSTKLAYKITDEILSSLVKDLLPRAIKIRTSLPDGTLSFNVALGFKSPNYNNYAPDNVKVTYDIKQQKFSIPDNPNIYSSQPNGYTGPIIIFTTYIDDLTYNQNTIEYIISNS